MSDIACSIANEGTAAVLKVTGQITYSEVAEFEKQAFEAASSKPPVLVIDMSEVSAVSSAGIGSLLKLDVKLRAQKCALRIAAPTPVIADIFRHARLNGVLKILPTVAAALN